VLGGLALSACAERGTLRLDGRAASHSSAPAIGSVRAGLTLGGGRLVIDRARIAVSEIELEGGSEDDELEAEMGGAVIDIELGGKPTTITVGEVEAGTYHTLGLEFTQANFEGHTASIVVAGTYDGAPFVFRSGWSPEAEFPLSPNVVVPAKGTGTAAVTLDVAAWFAEPDGSVLNPTDPASTTRIEGRLTASISAAAQIETGSEAD